MLNSSTIFSWMWSSNKGLKTKVVACILSMILIKVCTQEICGGQCFN